MANLPKLHRQLAELRTFFHGQMQPLRGWRCRQGHHPGAAAPDFKPQSWQTADPPCLWGGYDQTVWFWVEFIVPPMFAGKPLTLVVDLLDEHGEGLLFCNGEIIQGLDRHHNEVLMTSKAVRGETWRIAIEAYAGRIDAPRQFRSAAVGVPSAGVRDLYYSLKNGLEVLQLLPESHADRNRLARSLERAAAMIDWRQPGDRAFHSSAGRAAAALRKALRPLTSTLPAQLTPAGHAHIDVTWLWTVAEVKRKCARTFATVLRLMSQYPEFHFVQSQPQLYKFIKEDYPALYDQIKTRVREHRWEPVGAMWVESDTNLPCGESLVRQVVYGKQFFREEFGIDIENLWLPDVFGYSAALPQILRRAGIKYFFTAKIAWNDVNKFPHSTFFWRGIDGSEVIAHLTFLHNLYNSELTAGDLHEAWQTYKQKSAAADLLLSYGFGDGGGGPTAAHLENGRRLENFTGLPRLKRRSVAEFFAAIEKSAKGLPSWWGELYLEYHRGTLTTRARVKRHNRHCELLLREAEFWSAVALIVGALDEPPRLRNAWEKLLCNQFHDILPGSSIAEVYEQAEQDYERIETAAAQALQQTRAALLAPAPAEQELTLTLFNSLNWPRREPVEIFVPGRRGAVYFVDALGQVVPHQVLSAGKDGLRLLIQAAVPAAGWTQVELRPGKAPAWRSQLRAGKTVLENRWFRLRLNRRGQLTSIWDKISEREVLAPGEPGNVLETYEDMPGNWEAWDIDADFAAKPLRLFRCTGARVVERGPLRAALAFEHRSPRSTLRQNIMLYDEIPRIDFVTRVDWHETRVLLKTAFPVNILAPHATYEIQFGAIERPTHQNTSWDAAKFEVTAHKWADLSEGNYGVSLLNDCKYGHDIRGHRMRLTLLRSPYAPHPLYAGPHVRYEAPADQGEHTFTYSLYPHPGDWRQAMTVRRGYELNVPLQAAAGCAANACPPPPFRFFETSDENLVLDTAKPAENGDGIILRLYESAGQRGVAMLSFAAPLAGIEICNLLEEKEGELEGHQSRWRLPYLPFEIKTLRLRAEK